MRSVASVVIDRPIDIVFQLANDHVPDWSLVVVEDEMIEEKPGRVGSRFRTVTEDHGRRMEFQGVVTQYDPPRSSTVQLTGDQFDILTQFACEDLGGQTRVTHTAEITGKGLFKWLLLGLGWLMSKSHCQAGEKEMQSLKQFCESWAGGDSDAE